MKRLPLALLAVLVAAALTAAPAPAKSWHRCSGSGNYLVTHGVGCERATAVVRKFFGGAPTIRPAGNPKGWRCSQRKGDHTSDGGDSFDVRCHLLRDPERRLRYVWARS